MNLLTSLHFRLSAHQIVQDPRIVYLSRLNDPYYVLLAEEKLEPNTDWRHKKEEVVFIYINPQFMVDNKFL